MLKLFLGDKHSYLFSMKLKETGYKAIWPGPNVIKTFLRLDFTSFHNKLEYFQPSLMFMSKAGAYSS
jgi:hypothetical protein